MNNKAPEKLVETALVLVSNTDVLCVKAIEMFGAMQVKLRKWLTTSSVNHARFKEADRMLTQYLDRIIEMRVNVHEHISVDLNDANVDVGTLVRSVNMLEMYSNSVEDMLTECKRVLSNAGLGEVFDE